MARITVASLSARMDASEARTSEQIEALTSTVDVLAQSVAALTAHLSAPVTPEEPAKAKKPAARKAATPKKAAPAPKAAPKPAPAEKEPTAFYTDVIVGKREARAARKSFNPPAAAWMREKGLVPSGAAWAAVKAGERNVRTLKALNVADGLA